MPYTPPAGSAVDFTEPATAYVPPAGSSTDFDFNATTEILIPIIFVIE